MLIGMAWPGECKVASNLEDVPLEMQFNGVCRENDRNELVAHEWFCSLGH